MVRCGGWGAEVEEAKVRVGRYGGEDGGVVRGEGGGIGTTVGWEGGERGIMGGGPLFLFSPML